MKRKDLMAFLKWAWAHGQYILDDLVTELERDPTEAEVSKALANRYMAHLRREAKKATKP